MTTDLTPQIGGKTLEEWNLQWVRVRHGLKQHQAHLTEEVGLYRYLLDDQTMALAWERIARAASPSGYLI